MARLKAVQAKKPKGVRWGKVAELAGVNQVLRGKKPSERAATFGSLPLRLQHLSAWRRQHMFGGAKRGHQTVQYRAYRNGVASPSSNMSLRQKLEMVSYREARGSKVSMRKPG